MSLREREICYILGSLQNLPFYKDPDMFLVRVHQKHWMDEAHENTWGWRISLKSPVSILTMNAFTDCMMKKGFKKKGREDGGRIRSGDHLPSHKYIRNTSTCGTTPTEYPLNAGRRPQTSQKARNAPRTWVGQKKKEKTETKE